MTRLFFLGFMGIFGFLIGRTYSVRLAEAGFSSGILHATIWIYLTVGVIWLAWKYKSEA